MNATQYVVLAAAGLGLAGCMQPAAVAPPHTSLPVYSTDLAGKAASCTASPVKPLDGKTVEARITTGGGGWCAISVSQDMKPYAAGLLVRAPRAGRVYVHSVGDDTRIDYTPDAAGGVADSFAVRLLPGNAVIEVAVSPPTAAPATAATPPSAASRPTAASPATSAPPPSAASRPTAVNPPTKPAGK